MSEDLKYKIIELFKKNSNGYLALNDLQETIINVTYLFWNLKFVMKEDVSNIVSQDMLMQRLQRGNSENQDFIWDICNCCIPVLRQINIVNIFNYFNNLSEKAIIDIICDDYNQYTRFSMATPYSVCELSYKILETIKGNKILDLCSHTGSFLTYYAQRNKDYKYVGIEINYHNSVCAKERLSVLKVDYAIKIEDVFNSDNNSKYDKIFCHPPFALKLESTVLDKINHNNKLLETEITKRNTSDWFFVNEMLEKLSKDGKAIIIVPNGGLFKQPDLEIRRELITKGLVECVISLPGNIFYNTAIETTLIVFSYNNKSVKFIKANSMCTKNKKLNILDNNKILEEYLNNCDSKYTKIVDFDKIQNTNYSLLVDNYMNIEDIKIENPKKIENISETIYRGYQISTAEINQLSEKNVDNIPYNIINITNIIDNKIDDDLTSIFPTDNKMDKYLLKDKDLIISAKGILNKFAIVSVKDNEKYLPSGNFIVIRLNTSIINPYYLKIFLESNKGIALLNSIRSGGVLPSLNMSLLKSLNVPVPSMEEQINVVNKYFAKMDEIQILKSKLQNLEQDLKGLANDIF